MTLNGPTSTECCNGELGISMNTNRQPVRKRVSFLALSLTIGLRIAHPSLSRRLLISPSSTLMGISEMTSFVVGASLPPLNIVVGSVCAAPPLIEGTRFAVYWSEDRLATSPEFFEPLRLFPCLGFFQPQHTALKRLSRPLPSQTLAPRGLPPCWWSAGECLIVSPMFPEGTHNQRNTVDLTRRYSYAAEYQRALSPLLRDSET